MGFYFHRIPTLIQNLFPSHIWRISNFNNNIYLTFDDGPDPEATEFVLNTLDEFQAKATFFCLGINVEQHANMIQKMVGAGHQVANHGYQHLDGWKISKREYLENRRRGEVSLKNVVGSDKFQFRPPYGHFKSDQPTVLWSLMSGDFDPKLSKEKCLSILIAEVRKGDIVVFHDNEKSLNKLKWVLPRFLEHCKAEGYEFDLISKVR